MSNWSRWPNQPWIGERRRGWTSCADVQEGGRARAAVEVLVGAADGQLDAGVAQVDGQRARRVAEVPDHVRVVAARDVGQRAHVGQRARAVVDVREHDERHGAVAQRRLEVLGAARNIRSVRPRCSASPSST